MCSLLSSNKRAFDVSDIIIRGNKSEFVASPSNLSVIFNGRLTWSNHINAIVAKVYGMLRNLWTILDMNPFAIRMQLAKTFRIPVLSHGSEIFSNSDTDDRRKFNLAYNNIHSQICIYYRKSRPYIIIFLPEIFSNCDTDDRRKLNLAYNNIHRQTCIY